MNIRGLPDGVFDAEGFFRTGRTPRLGFPLAEIYTLADVGDSPDRWPPPAQERLSRPATWNDSYFRCWAEALGAGHADESSPPAAWAIVAFDADGSITACVECLPVFRDGAMAGVTLADARASRLWLCRSPDSERAYSPASARSAAALSVASQVNSGSSRPKWP